MSALLFLLVFAVSVWIVLFAPQSSWLGVWVASMFTGNFLAFFWVKN